MALGFDMDLTGGYWVNFRHTAEFNHSRVQLEWNKMQKRHTYRQQSVKQNYDPSLPQNMSNKTVSETCERTKITKAKSPWGGKYLTENTNLAFIQITRWFISYKLKFHIWTARA